MTTRKPNFAMLLGIAWLLVMTQLIARYWAGTGVSLFDTDDAMRLAQLHDWLSGQGWYDLSQPRVAVFGYETHWTRLVDAGLAGTLWVLRWFFEPSFAERLMRTLWPALWLLIAMAGTASIAWRLAGRSGAIIALLLVVVGQPAWAQFLPGRVDHHNVQIALCMLTLAAIVWSDRVRWAAGAAGVSSALALGVGVECAPYIAACGAVFAAKIVFDRAVSQEAVAYGLSVTAASIATFAALVAPEHWLRPLCDSLAINWVAAVVAGGLGLAAVGLASPESRRVRAVLVTAAGVGAVALLLGIEPHCVRGPLAMMDPAAGPAWLDYVTEMEPLAKLMGSEPSQAAGFMAFPLAGVVSSLLLLLCARRNDFPFLAAAALTIASFILVLAAIKFAYYAMWFAMPVVAAAALSLFDRFHVRTLAARFFVTVLLGPAALSVGALSAVQATTHVPERVDARRGGGCFDTASYASLARLPAGTVVADVDFGAFLLALTPHRIFAAPYHRLSAGVIAAHDALASPPDTARVALKRLDATYVVTCGSVPPVGLDETRMRSSLWAHLETGDLPAWIERVEWTATKPFAVYRVRP